MRRWRILLLLAAGSVLHALNSAQAVPPLGPLVLGLNVPDQSHIVLYDLELDFARRVVLGEGAHTLWGFTPDGCRLLATLDEQLITARLDGGGVRRLLPSGVGGAYEPSFSPDGRRLVFTLIQPEGRFIALVPAEGGSPQVLSVSGREATPRWSPDGERIAYVSYEQRVAGADLFSTAVPTPTPAPNVPPPPAVLLNEADLWLADARSGQRTRLTNFPTGSVSMPRWSPDGSLLAFVYSPAPNQDLLWIIAAEGGAIPTQLSYEYTTALDLGWLPDGTHLIASLMGMQGAAENTLWQIPLTGRAEQGALRYLAFYDLPHADYPRFRDDGRWLALRTRYQIALIDTVSAELQRLSAPWALGNTPPVWSPTAFNGEAACAE
jgi:Tol biopolymer transport system component